MVVSSDSREKSSIREGGEGSADWLRGGGGGSGKTKQQCKKVRA